MTNALEDFYNTRREAFETAFEITKYKGNFYASDKDIDELFKLADRIYNYIYQTAPKTEVQDEMICERKQK